MPAIGCLALLLPAAFLITAVGTFLPDDPVPDVKALPDGSVEYVFQSMREAALIPVGALVVALFIVVAALLFRPRRPVVPAVGEAGGPPEPEPEPRRAGRSRLELAWGAGAALAVTVALALAGLAGAEPLKRFRRAVVTPDRVEMCSLLGRWSVPRSEVAAARVRTVTRGDGRALVLEVSVEISDRAGRTWSSSARSFLHGDPGVTRWRDALRRFAEDVLREPPGRAPLVGPLKKWRVLGLSSWAVEQWNAGEQIISTSSLSC